jgi:hypothetical protein
MRRAFVGRSTPIGYDYKREAELGAPNPVLENVSGLLICYDEIWFPSRHFCPADLRFLDYVKFIEDDPVLVGRAHFAIEEASQATAGRLLEPFLIDDSEAYWQTLEKLRDAGGLMLDNHSRGSEFGVGNAGELGLWRGDVAIASYLDHSFDVIGNSRLKLRALAADEPNTKLTQHRQLNIAEEVVRLKTLDLVSSAGSYHPSIEELRDHPNVRDFRRFLAEAEGIKASDVAFVTEIERLAGQYARDALRRSVHKPSKLELLKTASLTGLGPALNAVIPHAGTVTSAILKRAVGRREREEKRAVAWASFVVDSRSGAIR